MWLFTKSENEKIVNDLREKKERLAQELVKLKARLNRLEESLNIKEEDCERAGMKKARFFIFTPILSTLSLCLCLYFSSKLLKLRVCKPNYNERNLSMNK